MLFLMPNQLCQSTEGKKVAVVMLCKLNRMSMLAITVQFSSLAIASLVQFLLWQLHLYGFVFNHYDH